MSGVAILLPAGSRVVARVRGAIRRLSLSILLIVVLGARYEVVTVSSRTSCTTVYTVCTRADFDFAVRGACGR